MINKILLGVAALGVAACTFPNTPGEGNLLNGTKQHRAELFESGARGQVIASMTDNVSDDGWFSKNYENILSFKNLQTGEVYSLQTKLDDKEYDTAMLPVGEYQVTNLYLQYVYTTNQRQGNMTISTTHVETMEHFEGSDKIRFTVKPSEVVYIGNFELIKSENKVNPDGSKSVNSYKITDKSAEIPTKQKDAWKKEFGKNYIVRIATAK